MKCRKNHDSHVLSQYDPACPPCDLSACCQVVMSELDPRLAYIQVTHLTPHWDDVDLDRPTEFERNSNIKQVRPHSA